jgi:aminoglycoside phosphotransferase (APT) family kinase protein
MGVEHVLDYDATAVRPAWAELPEAVRRLVTGRLGARVVHASSQGAGFTPGFASRLGCADGQRVFVKAASSAEPVIADCYRDEARIVAALPPGLPVPRLRWVSDDGDWVVLCFEDVPGRSPRRPWQPAQLDLVLDTVGRLGTALSPAPPGIALPTAEQVLAEDFTGWRSLLDGGTDGSDLLDSDGWAVSQLERLAELEAGALALCAGDSLVHGDLRPDNVIVADDGRAFVCDWNWSCRAAPWLDLVCLLPGVYADGFDADALLAAHSVGRSAQPPAVDALLAGLAGYFAVASRRPQVPTSPSLRRHQAVYGAATLGWLRARLTAANPALSGIASLPRPAHPALSRITPPPGPSAASWPSGSL